MNRKNYRILLLLILLIIVAPPMLFADEKNNIQYKFTHTDTTLSFYGSFKTDKSPACLLEIFLNYKHIQALAPDAIEVQLIEQGNNWNRLRYIFRKFMIFENVSVWIRRLDAENQRVEFILVSSVNNKIAMPKMISSRGFYQVRKQGDNLIVEYYQFSQLTKSLLTNIYYNIFENEAAHFMKKLLEYTNTICSDKTVGEP